MKKVFNFLLLMLIAASLAAQNKTDEKGRKQGFWTKTDRKGVKIYEGTFVDNCEIGIFKYYYRSGKLRATTEFSENGHKGRTIVFYPNQSKMAEGFYVDKKKDSLWTIYAKDGRKLNENFFKKGSKEGIWKVFNKEGKIIEEIRYVNDKKNGLCLHGMEDGGYFYCNYKDDLREGEYREYFQGGVLHKTGQNKTDKKDGQWLIYDESGMTVVAKQTYTNDVMGSFDVSLLNADGERFVGIEQINYFYPKGKQTIVVLIDGEAVSVLRDYNYLLHLSGGLYFLRLNEKMNLYASSAALKGIDPAPDGNYYIRLSPELPFKVVTDENSKKAMEFIFLPQDF
ncbi:MAG: hypothetical protein LBU51_05770 [Bacteroidales bacterium]|jgi:antitoxin component YwqK of YwqJK toxin-antitoxin module|nr:hypothetical protein [Bacteroidales bacterium]